MSTTEAVRGGLDELPTFDLDFGFDDPDEPGEVTIFAPDSGAITTTWLSIDVRFAVSLDDVA